MHAAFWVLVIVCGVLLYVGVLASIIVTMWKDHAQHKKWLNGLVQISRLNGENAEVEQWRTWEINLEQALVEYVEANSAAFRACKDGHGAVTVEQHCRIIMALGELSKVFKETPKAH